MFNKCNRYSFEALKNLIDGRFLRDLFSKQLIIVGDLSECERDYIKDPEFVKKPAVSYEEAMNYAHDAGFLYIEASRDSYFNMENVAKLACQTYLGCGLRKS